MNLFQDLADGSNDGVHFVYNISTPRLYVNIHPIYSFIDEIVFCDFLFVILNKYIYLQVHV